MARQGGYKLVCIHCGESRRFHAALFYERESRTPWLYTRGEGFGGCAAANVLVLPRSVWLPDDAQGCVHPQFALMQDPTGAGSMYNFRNFSTSRRLSASSLDTHILYCIYPGN